MKTPMQEHIEWMQEKLRILVEYKDLSAGAEVDECIQHAESMLEKEKEMLAGVWLDAQVAYQGDEYIKPSDPTFDEYYEETFNTEEK